MVSVRLHPLPDRVDDAVDGGLRGCDQLSHLDPPVVTGAPSVGSLYPLDERGRADSTSNVRSACSASPKAAARSESADQPTDGGGREVGAVSRCPATVAKIPVGVEVGADAVDLGAVGDQPAAAAAARRPVAVDAEGRRAGKRGGEEVVADVVGGARLHEPSLAGIAEALELLVAAEVGGDRGAAADAVGQVHPGGVGPGEEGPEVEVGVAVPGPLPRRAEAAAAGDEDPERGGAAPVAGDELEVVGPDAGPTALATAVEAVAGGQDQLPGRTVDRGARAEAGESAAAEEDAAVEGEGRQLGGGDADEAGAGSAFSNRCTDPEVRPAAAVDGEVDRAGGAE